MKKHRQDNFVRSTSDSFEAYSKISGMKEKFGVFYKCIFHMHTPASYDYRLLKEYSNENEYSKCTTEYIYKLCIKNHVFPKTIPIEVFEDKNQFPDYKDSKECLTYLLIAQKIIDFKVEMVVVTDHNTIGGYYKLKFAIANLKKVKKNGIYPEIILGIELSCADKNHVVGIFEDNNKNIETIGKWLSENVLSERDGTYLTSFLVLQEIHKIGGISYIAHIDTSNTFSDKYLSGAYKKKLFGLNCFQVVGLSNKNKQDVIQRNISEFTNKEICFVVDEDSHTIDEIGTKSIWIKGSKRNLTMIKDALRDFRIALEYEQPKDPDNYIKGIYIKGNSESFLSGKQNNEFCLSFSNSLNCIIGGRGTGKSTVLQMIEFVIRQHCDNERVLDFICRHEAIWLLFLHDKKDYLLHFYAPLKEYWDDPILKYFTDNRRHGYDWKYYFNIKEVEDYALTNYITIEQVEMSDGHLFSKHIKDKRTYLEKFFHVRYSVNDLVRTAGSEEINSFIYKTMFQNKTLANASKIVNVRSKSGLKNTIKDIQSIIVKRKDDVCKIIDEFNEKQDGLFKIIYSQDNNTNGLDFEDIVNNIHSSEKYFNNMNIETETISEYLYSLNSHIGILNLLLLAFEKEYDKINEILPISDMLLEPSEYMVEKGIEFVNQENEINLIKNIMEDLLDDRNINLIIDYLKSYVTDIESFTLEFNLNSKESNKNMAPLYRNVKNLSLGQKVVAMLSFVLGYSDYSQDFTPFIIDQPEDNLDNQYIYRTLVKQLRDIKLKRQVIIATHNATIVTNAKAEQVVIMESDNTKGWVEATGYPNEKCIKKHIINYLEGGIDSFKHKCFVYDEVINDHK